MWWARSCEKNQNVNHANNNRIMRRSSAVLVDARTKKIIPAASPRIDIPAPCAVVNLRRLPAICLLCFTSFGSQQVEEARFQVFDRRNECS